MFEDDKSLVEVVKELRIPIETVDALYKAYRNSDLDRRYRHDAIAEAARNGDEDE